MMTEENLSVLEGWVIALSVIVVFSTTMAAPQLHHVMARDELAVANAGKTKLISELAATLESARQDNTSLRAEAVETGRLLEQVRCELAALKQERDTLIGQVAVANEKLRELDSRLQTTGLEAAKLKEFLSLQETQKERDDAAERAKKAEDRIRELTLQLHRAGVWP
ncbi:MAG: hypothetical protein RBS72_18060 [Sedimentisphaerales bacterium]|jgi:chromosome segregation ATPase|nr:hypothetical protein [Sedimentisphaerales bacterium]NLZ06480.1 hypothetical protein [Phycisphaerae bacterium]HNY78453.1 hypothetical protein [Sedimentisphaerales bacterium]HOC63654.1 hypothetical protein [Sedimentisphaerales bacterium]HOH64407.1 hypothetical protein [Sedimentisphaerales bacterium]